MKRYGPPKAPRRWLKLAKVADLMAIEHPSRHYRVQFVRRLLKRLEKRDGTAYLRRFGEPPGPGRRGSDWYVSPAILEQIVESAQTAPTKLRADLDETREDVQDLRRKVNGHGARIRDLEKARKGFETYMQIMAET